MIRVGNSGDARDSFIYSYSHIKIYGKSLCHKHPRRTEGETRQILLREQNHHQRIFDKSLGKCPGGEEMLIDDASFVVGVIVGFAAMIVYDWLRMKLKKDERKKVK